MCQPGRSSGAIAAWHPSTRAGVCATLHVAWIDGSPTDPQQIPGGTPTDLRRIPIRSLTGFLQIPDGSPSDPRWIPIRSPTDPHQIPDGSPSDPRRIQIPDGSPSDPRRIPIRSPTDGSPSDPRRSSFQSLYGRYRLLQSFLLHGSTAEEVHQGCAALLATLQLRPDEYRLGRESVFLRAGESLLGCVARGEASRCWGVWRGEASRCWGVWRVVRRDVGVCGAVRRDVGVCGAW